jgi:glycosyltransferase involved in cell wall biosynthesis
MPVRLLHVQVAHGLSPQARVCAGALQEMARALGVADRVHFLGRRAGVPRLLAATGLFVHPSRQDSCPMALRVTGRAGEVRGGGGGACG